MGVFLFLYCCFQLTYFNGNIVKFSGIFFQLCLHDAGIDISRCPLVFSRGAGRGWALHQDATAGLPGSLRPLRLQDDQVSLRQVPLSLWTGQQQSCLCWLSVFSCTIWSRLKNSKKMWPALLISFSRLWAISVGAWCEAVGEVAHRDVPRPRVCRTLHHLEAAQSFGVFSAGLCSDYLIQPYTFTFGWWCFKLNSNARSTHEPVSYTHLTLPTILLV